MTDIADNTEDPWAWLHSRPGVEGPVWADVVVTAIVEPVPGGDTERCLDALERGEVTPDEITVSDPDAGCEADWLWLLTADCEPSPDALKHLLVALERHPDLAVIGPLQVEPRRRGPGTVISQYGQTISSHGRLRSLARSGEIYQGQLEFAEVLGVDAAGALVRGDVWRELSGFNRELPAEYRGIEFGWRANLAGHRVAVEPSAQVVNHAVPLDIGEARAAGLAVVGAHLAPGRRLLGRIRLVLLSLLSALGFVIGKDGARAAGELTGLGRWLGRGEVHRSVTQAVRSVAVTPQARDRVRSLRPSRGSGIRRAAEGAAERMSEWVASFSGPADAATLDELTSDEYAERRRPAPLVSPLLAGLVITVALAVAAGRTALGTGSLQARWLLPAPSGWLDLIGGYVAAAPGQEGLRAPVWQGLMGLASFITGGQPEWLVSILVLGCVPLAWLTAFRLLSQLVSSSGLAGAAAFGFAVSPVLLGGLNVGAVGVAVLAVALPALAYQVRSWQAEPVTTWRGAAGIAFWGLLLTAVFPLSWLLLVVALTVVAIRRGARTWLQFTLAAGGPLALLASWWSTLVAYPGRLLTGIEPTMADTAAVEAWEVLLGRAAGTSPPLWLSLVVVGALWVVALAGALRRPGKASVAFGAAAIAAAAAVLLTRLVVQVPPGEWARPSGMELLVLAAGALVLAAAWGFDGLTAELRGANLGLRHVGSLGLTVVVAAMIALACGWWVLAGESGLYRAPASSLPAYVRNAQTSPTPARTLALDLTGQAANWALLEDDLPRLGEAERGLVADGDPAAKELAASVVARLVSGSGDDQLLADLRTLGVAHVWLTGGNATDRLLISNSPGLGLGTGDPDVVWPVEGSGRAVVIAGAEPTLTGNGQELPPGDELRLAERADDRWQATVGGRALSPLSSDGFGQVFDAAGASGVLEFGLQEPHPWWAWAQLAGLGLLLLLAAPGLRRPSEPTGPRRISERPQPGPDTAPRRAIGGAR